MAALSGSVGRNGVNRMQDVALVQELLNFSRAGAIPMLPPLRRDGQCGKLTIAAIEEFQKRVVRLPLPDGRVDSHGRTWQALDASTRSQRLSGSAWWHAHQAKYTNSTQTSDLSPPFRAKVEHFLAAMKNARINIVISTTRRSRERAYLMHYSWMIAKSATPPGSVPGMPGVDIAWDHGNLAASRKGAQEMVDLFGIAFKPSLHSRHIEGNAIDMTLTWAGKVVVLNKAGQKVDVAPPGNGAINSALHKVGASYGVVKNLDDPPHWSTDGH